MDIRARKARHLTLSKSTDQLAVAIKPTLSYYTTLTPCARLTNINTSLIVLKTTSDTVVTDRGRTDQRGILARRTLRAHLAVWLQVHRLHRTFVKMAIADISELASHIYEPRILEQLMKKRRRRRRWPTSTTMTRRRWCRKY